MLTEEQLAEIQKRNRTRKELKSQVSPRPWEYDSFGFVHQSLAVKPNRRIGILLRPETWFRNLQKTYGPDFLDKGFSPSKFVQAYYDAEYMISERNGNAEDDIDALLAEVKLLRRNSK